MLDLLSGFKGSFQRSIPERETSLLERNPEITSNLESLPPEINLAKRNV
jgi:hypothetical protein